MFSCVLCGFETFIGDFAIQDIILLELPLVSPKTLKKIFFWGGPGNVGMRTFRRSGFLKSSSVPPFFKDEEKLSASQL